MEPPADAARPRPLEPRGYQLEMLDESLKRNILVAMDTGSGKTNIATLRIALNLSSPSSSQQQPHRRVWFLVDKVALAHQQSRVLSAALSPPHAVRLLTGASGVESWTSRRVWEESVLRGVDVAVATHQVLLDALVHGFVRLAEISLLVFDEAHHCRAAHPAAKIMLRFYHEAKRSGEYVPQVLGLSASPVLQGGGGLAEVEANLDAIARSPRVNREELARFVHVPVLETVVYFQSARGADEVLSGMGDMLRYLETNAKEDPFVVYMMKLGDGGGDDGKEQREGRLRKALAGKTFCREQTRKMLGAATDLHLELGSWAAAYYLKSCIAGYAEKQASTTAMLADELANNEARYLLHSFARFVPTADVPPISDRASLSSKAETLIQICLRETSGSSAGIVFIERRATVWLLSRILGTDPRTRDLLRVGTFVGTSTHARRDGAVGDLGFAKDQDDNLDQLRTGAKNLILATSVCEEGIDISACSLVVCFDKPPSLRSFIQRRGRARAARSKFVAMVADANDGSLAEWTALEDKMKQMYMDDMRQLQALEERERDEPGDRVFLVQDTGAKLHLDEGVRHLFHFCSTLPQPSGRPIFAFEHDAQDEESIACRVLLPISVDASAREFRSRDRWCSERRARQDAAFEECVGLYRAGLLDGHFMPVSFVDEEAEHARREIEKRPNVVAVDEQMDPWREVAAAWRAGGPLRRHSLSVESDRGENVEMEIICPALVEFEDLVLHLGAGAVARARLRYAGDVEREALGTEAGEITQLVLSSGLANRMSAEKRSFLALCVPSEALADMESWMAHSSGSFEASALLEGKDFSRVGLVTERSQSDVQYVFHAIEKTKVEGAASGEEEEVARIRARRFPKKRNFIYEADGISDPVLAADPATALLDPRSCSVAHLPVRYAWFAILYPSIMDHVGKRLTAKRCCESLFGSVGFSDATRRAATATTAPSALAGADYQRLEFLGDSLLKHRTSLVLAASHPTWHEGMLDGAKGHIVSNGTLAVAAQRLGLARFVVTRPFAFHKWRMGYVEDMAVEPAAEEPERELSTKVLADVVEALLGAAYLDAGEDGLQRCLGIVLPKVPWLEPAASYEKMSASSSASAADSSGDSEARMSLPLRYRPLEELLGYEFRNKSLLMEAITHASFPSVAGTASYQRLEFVGDAVLDDIVTRLIFEHRRRCGGDRLPVKRMHTLRTTAVNANLLAFFALRLKEASPEAATEMLRLSLPSFLRSDPSASSLARDIADAQKRFEALCPSIEHQLEFGTRYPWTDLAALDAAKVVSDLVESTLGAIAVDSAGDERMCEAWLERLGLLPWLRRVLERGGKGDGDRDGEMEMLHPKEGLGIEACERRVFYRTEVKMRSQSGEDNNDDTNWAGDGKGDGDWGKGEDGTRRVRYACEVSVGERLVCEAEGISRMEAEARAAERALGILRAEREGGRRGGADEMLIDGEGDGHGHEHGDEMLVDGKEDRMGDDMLIDGEEDIDGDVFYDAV